MTSILASSMLLKSILSKVVFTYIRSMSMVPVFQSIFGLYCFSHGSPKIIFSFPSLVARNLVLIFFFSICILSHAQCSIIPALFIILFTLKAWIGFSIGIKAILFCWVNFLSMKVPPAPESIRAFISNLLSAFLPSPNTNKGTLNDFLLVSAEYYEVMTPKFTPLHSLTVFQVFSLQLAIILVFRWPVRPISNSWSWGSDGSRSRRYFRITLSSLRKP